MKYQFDKPPTREAIIQEFGINPDRLHRIETFIQSAVPNEDDFDLSKEQFSIVEAAFILKKLNLVEAFALLCSLPWNGWGRLVTLPGFFNAPCGVSDPLEISALFDKFGTLLRWEIKKIPFATSEPWIFEVRPPSELAADQAWMRAHYEAAEATENHMEEFKHSTAVAAVSRCPLSTVQWRRKYVGERWSDPGLGISSRLVEDEDLAAWNSFVMHPSKAMAALSRFEKWAQGREKWDSVPPAE